MKIAVFIDGPNFWTSLVSVQMQCNYAKMKAWLDQQCDQYEIMYYTATSADEQGFINVKKMLDYMEYHGIRVIQKPVQIVAREDKSREAMMKGNLDVEIAVDMMMVGQNFDRIMLFSGDGDFTYCVQRLREMGKHVTVISSFIEHEGAESRSTVSDRLRRMASVFINIADKRQVLGPGSDKTYSDDSRSVLPFIERHKKKEESNGQ